MSLPHEIAEQQARCDEYNKKLWLEREAELERLRKLTPLEFLCAVWQDPDLPMHTRLRAAAEHDPSELRPNPTSAANGGFKRRF